jgi:hypothetical protein
MMVFPEHEWHDLMYHTWLVLQLGRLRESLRRPSIRDIELPWKLTVFHGYMNQSTQMSGYPFSEAKICFLRHELSVLLPPILSQTSYNLTNFMGKFNNIYGTNLVPIDPSWDIVSYYTDVISYMLLFFSIKFLQFIKIDLMEELEVHLFEGGSIVPVHTSISTNRLHYKATITDWPIWVISMTIPSWFFTSWHILCYQWQSQPSIAFFFSLLKEKKRD